VSGRKPQKIPVYYPDTVSEENDLSDVSYYYQWKTATTVTEYVLVDVSDGPKTVLQVSALGERIANTAGDTDRIGPITVDGTKVGAYPAAEHFSARNANNYRIPTFTGFPFTYDSSLKVEWETRGTYYVCAYAFILGSGPHSVAVVKDGEPVYMTAGNLSEETIEEMNAPSGYEIVKHPSIDHPDPQTRGMWDADKEEVVDHPFLKPFHDTLDRLDEMSRRETVQKVLDKIDEKPTSYEGVLEGEMPREDPVEEAIQFWYEREKERTSKLSLGDLRD